MSRKIVLVGSPNVGKSLVFNRLTGAYVVVSNYPGTTVEVARGQTKIGGLDCEIVDTPGMYSFSPITEEERVARSLLLAERPDIVVHVTDAKNLERMLPLTLSLGEAGFRMVLVLNMMDEARALGMRIDAKAIERLLGVPVVATVSTTGEGIHDLRARLGDLVGDAATSPPPGPRLRAVVRYGDEVEPSLGRLQAKLAGDYPLSTRAVALLLLQFDQEVQDMVRVRECRQGHELLDSVARSLRGLSAPASYIIALARHSEAQRLVKASVKLPAQGLKSSFAGALGSLSMHPVAGIPILALVLYYGLYRFVGVFGAGTLVDFLEIRVFEAMLIPGVNRLLRDYVGWAPLVDLLGNEYGIFTMAFRYAFAIILPIVGSFFLAFSMIEDSGYLPRLALLVDRLFKAVGLSGRAVIPLTLGLGCDTMATVVSRTLETGRERFVATLLLALAVPCSAQLGIILALLSGRPGALLLWAGLVFWVLLLVGFLAGKLLPGRRPSFYIEVPPLRWPRLSNVAVKTYSRMQWYMHEVLPLFIWASVIIWAGRLLGIFDAAVALLRPVVTFIGLPEEAAVPFLFGFFRRDYGAAGLYDLAGRMTGRQLLVAATTLTLFVPCIAQFSMMVKERGLLAALAILGFIVPFAFGVGFLVNLVLSALGVYL